MLPSCRQVSELLSENLDKPLTGIRWLKVKLHLLMCGACRRYAKQLNLSVKTIDKVCGHTTREHQSDVSQCQPNQAMKQQLLKIYRQHNSHRVTQQD